MQQLVLSRAVFVGLLLQTAAETDSEDNTNDHIGVRAWGLPSVFSVKTFGFVNIFLFLGVAVAAHVLV